MDRVCAPEPAFRKVWSSGMPFIPSFLGLLTLEHPSEVLSLLMIIGKGKGELSKHTLWSFLLATPYDICECGTSPNEPKYPFLL